MSQLDETLASLRDEHEYDGYVVSVDYVTRLEQMLRLAVSQRDFMLTQMHQPWATVMKLDYDAELAATARGEG